MSKRSVLFLTGSGWTPKSGDEAYAGWNDEKQFKMWNGPVCTVRDFLRIQMTGWNFIYFVFQRDDMSVGAAILDLATYSMPILKDTKDWEGRINHVTDSNQPAQHAAGAAVGQAGQSLENPGVLHAPEPNARPPGAADD